MNEGVRSFFGREWIPTCAAAAVTLCIFLILPLLEWFNRDEVKEFTLREVNTVRLPEDSPPVALPRTPAEEWVERVVLPPMPVPPVQALPRVPLDSAVQVLSARMEPSDVLQVSDAWRTFEPMSVGYWDLSDVDHPPSPLSQMKPIYPLRARNAGMEGYVVLEMLVDEQGRIRQVAVAEANPPGYFEQAALRAAGAWRFVAATKDGMPVPVRVVQKLTFKLDERTP
ncbi:MAG: energy transducer TonB [Kiritimatiellae bacterium]|nr:energy transducer TonB [Kiritimatiellia bacterium]